MCLKKSKTCTLLNEINRLRNELKQTKCGRCRMEMDGKVLKQLYFQFTVNIQIKHVIKRIPMPQNFLDSSTNKCDTNKPGKKIEEYEKLLANNK